MIRQGILNPQLLSLLARIRHTNRLVISDRGFPFFSQIETVDISLVDDIPTVLQVLSAIRPNFDICQIYMAEEFQVENTNETRQQFAHVIGNIPVIFVPYQQFKQQVPEAVGLIRTGDTIQYANMILVSGRVDPVISRL
jgi:D-ribose pyranase